MFMPNDSSNRRFDGYIRVTIRDKVYTIDASRFELAEGDTRPIGDGDRLYEELWIASPEQSDDPDEAVEFDRVQVSITRLNDGPFEFAGPVQVVGASTRLVEVEDELELRAPADQGPGVAPY